MIIKHLIFTVTAIGILLFFPAAANAGAISVAANGRTGYTIIPPAVPSGDEPAAVKDLQHFLNRITGAEFSINGNTPHRIYVGRRAPGDKLPLRRSERRVRCENGDIYIYGQGRSGNTFAVYDFLEKFFNCRWYTFYGDMVIPEKRIAVFSDLHMDLVPSFSHHEYRGGKHLVRRSSFELFRRASRSYDRKILPPEPELIDGHAMSRLIPPRKGPAADNLEGTLKYFKDKEYFKTNPEFFSLRNGTRLPAFQYCFSNRELRRELLKNLDTVMKNEYRGGAARVSLTLNDKGLLGDKCCYCRECGKLNRKYRSNCGSYWDFVLECSRHFSRKYPEVKLLTLGYDISCIPPAGGIKTFPDNVIVSVAPLSETDFMKSYRQTPDVHKIIKGWSRKLAAGRLSLWTYPTVYPRPLWTRPLTANINRIIANLREAHRLGVSELYSEFGCNATDTTGFNELRMYLIACLARNVDADTSALIKDFMEHYYGAAASLMQKYLAELEECEKNEKNTMRWWPDHRSVLSYLTPENLLRWQGYFDRMEKLTSQDTKANMHVRRTRINLEEATMSVWYKFKPGEMPDRDTIYRRYKQALYDSEKDAFATYQPAAERKKLIKQSVAWQDRSMYYHYALAGKWRPLPEKFAKLPGGSVKRTVPFFSRKVLDRNVAGSATGIAVKTAMNRSVNFRFDHFNGVKRIRRHFKPVSTLRALKNNEGKFEYYYIGTSKLYQDSMMDTGGTFRIVSGAMLGYLFEQENPEQKYDIYLSLKPEGKTIWFDEVLLVKSEKPETFK